MADHLHITDTHNDVNEKKIWEENKSKIEAMKTLLFNFWYDLPENKGDNENVNLRVYNRNGDLIIQGTMIRSRMNKYIDLVRCLVDENRSNEKKEQRKKNTFATIAFWLSIAAFLFTIIKFLIELGCDK